MKTTIKILFALLYLFFIHTTAVNASSATCVYETPVVFEGDVDLNIKITFNHDGSTLTSKMSLPELTLNESQLSAQTGVEIIEIGGKYSRVGASYQYIVNSPQLTKNQFEADAILKCPPRLYYSDVISSSASFSNFYAHEITIDHDPARLVNSTPTLLLENESSVLNDSTITKKITFGCNYKDLFLVNYYDDKTIEIEGKGRFANRQLVYASEMASSFASGCLSKIYSTCYETDEKISYASCDVQAESDGKGFWSSFVEYPLKGNETSQADIENTYNNDSSSPTEVGAPQPVNCSDFNSDGGNIIKNIYDIILVAAPILVIVLGSVDILKATIASDEDKMKKAKKHFITRLIALVLLLMLPWIINFMLEIATGAGIFTNGVPDICVK